MKKTYTLVLLFSQLMLTGYSQDDNTVSTGGDVEIVNCDKNFPKVEIGWSYSGENEFPFPSRGGCPFITCNPTSKPQPNSILKLDDKNRTAVNGVNVDIAGKLIKSELDYCVAKDFNIKAAANYKFVKVSGSLSKTYDYHKNSKTVYWYIDFQKINRVEYLDNYNLNEDAKTLFKKNKPEYINQYGKYYVATIHYGQRVRLFFSYEATSETEATNFSAQVDAYINYVKFGGSLNTSTKEAVKRVLNSSRVSIEVNAVGVNSSSALIDLILSSPENISDNVRAFLLSSLNTEGPVKLGIRSSFPNPTINDPSDIILSKALNTAYKMETEINLLDKINNSSRYSDAEKKQYKIVEQRQQREAFNITLSKLAKVYLADPTNQESETNILTHMNKVDNDDFKLNIPNWYVFSGSVNSCYGNNQRGTVTLYLRPNTNYGIHLSVSANPESPHGDNGNWELDASHDCPEAGKSIGFDHYLTKSNSQFSTSSDYTINTGNNSVFNFSIFSTHTVWCKDGSCVTNGICTKFGLTVTAVEQ